MGEFLEDMSENARIRKLERDYLDVRFSAVEKELKNIRELLESSIVKTNEKVIGLEQAVKDLEHRINNLEKTQGRCQIHNIALRVRLLEKQTLYARVLLKNPVTMFLTVGFIVLILFIGLYLIDFVPIVKIIDILKHF